jgi:hypothetical protein
VKVFQQEMLPITLRSFRPHDRAAIGSRIRGGPRNLLRRIVAHDDSIEAHVYNGSLGWNFQKGLDPKKLDSWMTNRRKTMQQQQQQRIYNWDAGHPGTTHLSCGKTA